MIGGAPFWRDIDVPRVPRPPLHLQPVDPDYGRAACAVWFVCLLWDVEQNDMFSHRRAERLVHARALVVWMLRTDPAGAVSYPKIGRALGNRDHTTIINLHRMAIRLRLESAQFAQACAEIAKERKELRHGS